MNKLSYKPTSIKESIEAIDNLLSEKESSQLINSKREDLILYHSGLGRWIRNNWDLWGGGQLFEHMKSVGFIHPDDMSQTLIEEYWLQKINLPSEVQEKINKYKQFWEDQK